MIAAWMLATTIVALLLCGAAMLAQRVLALYRGVPVRWVWAAALAGTCALAASWMLPLAAHQPHSRSLISDGGGVLHAVTPESLFRLPAFPAGVDRGLFVVWLLASVGLLTTLMVAALRFRRERHEWHHGTVAGKEVDISPSVGPAVVGLFRSRVVIPRWVLCLDLASQHAIIAHEREHLRARDPVLLAAGLAVLVLMPWNVGAWLAWRGPPPSRGVRLRRARACARH